MNRIETILFNARIPLNDTSKERWSDAQLLQYLDKGQKDIAKECNMLVDSVIIPLKTSQAIYRLPENTLELLGCRFNGIKVHLRPTAWMDNQASIPTLQYAMSNLFSSTYNWEKTTNAGEVVNIIYDKMKRRNFRVWPIPISEELEEVLTELETDYGVTTAVTEFDTTLPLYGVVSDYLDVDNAPSDFTNGLYGLLMEIVDQTTMVMARAYLPETVISTEDTLELDIVCDEALEYFITARAFSNDIIDQNRPKAAEQLTWYSREITKLKDSCESQMVSSDHHQTQYNGMGA
jgi:hypothetical protein